MQKVYIAQPAIATSLVRVQRSPQGNARLSRSLMVRCQNVSAESSMDELQSNRVKQNPAYGLVQSKDFKRAAGITTVDEAQLTALDEMTIKPVEEEARLDGVLLWFTLAMIVGIAIGVQRGVDDAEAYFAGYLLEQSLSVDNLFVFILIFEYFKCPRQLQNRVLNVGIASSAVLRLTMILLGSELVENFRPVLLVFAGILIYSAAKLIFDGDEDEEEDLSNNFIVKLTKRFVTVSSTYDNDKFFTVENGVKVATPLVLVLAVVELSDVLFAVDSVPAIFGVTLDPFIVYSSNMMAILSLRSLFQFVAVAMSNLKYLDKSVAGVLGFIGVKMVADFGGVHVDTRTSLLVVATILGGGVAASLAAKSSEAERS